MANHQTSINQKLDTVEQALADVVSKIAPWLAPVPTAYLVGRATIAHLAWPLPIAIVAAVIIEALGLAATSTALTLREYNASKRKSDPGAPFNLALFLVGVYLFVALALTVALDVLPRFARFAPAIFPILSVTGMTTLALRSDHSRRTGAIEAEKEARAAKRRARRVSKRQPQTVQATVQGTQSSVQNNDQDGVLGAVNVQKRADKAQLMDRLLDIFLDSPEVGATQLARQLGVSRSTIYNYLSELEDAGRIKKNGQGVTVIGG